MLGAMSADELINDPGVLDAEPMCEFQGFGAVARAGGTAVLPWRSAALEAELQDVEHVADAAALGDAQFGQALVHLQKSRPGTWRDLCDAWAHLTPGGRLLLVGGNDLGITSAAKRLAKELDQKPVILANRRHARIVAFERSQTSGPEAPESRSISLPHGDDTSVELEAEPGVFSTRKLDPGTALLLGHLTERANDKKNTPKRVLDLACGIGPLGFAALTHWPTAEATLLDGDARAIRSAQRNARALGLADRTKIDWWDAREAIEGPGFDLVLMNPPFHTGKEVDLEPARAMIAQLATVLAPRGRALIVANRTLPYERELDAVGRSETLAQVRGYKLISLRKSVRSARSSGRKPPGGRSAGRS
jgi:16S rRNA (guanine1207-N2)-methyltransferase